MHFKCTTDSTTAVQYSLKGHFHFFNLAQKLQSTNTMQTFAKADKKAWPKYFISIVDLETDVERQRLATIQLSKNPL